MVPNPQDLPAPSAETLEALPPDVWAQLLPHVRSALHALEEHELTKRMEQLRATPTDRLAGGRARRDLCRLLASTGRLWQETARSLVAAADLGDVVEELAGNKPAEQQAPAAKQPAPQPTGPTPTERRLRARNRELVAERDDARRRATGLEARLETERRRLAEIEEQLAAVRAERDDLTRRLDDVVDDHRQALERERRRHRIEMAELEHELDSYRRSKERERQRRAHERAQRAADRRRAEEARQRAREEIAAYRAVRSASDRPAGFASCGGLSPEVQTDGAEALRELLTEGRQLLIDGYNVTKQHRPDIPLADQRAWLVRLLEGLASRTGVRPTVVFDGREDTATSSSSGRLVQVVFTRGESADDELVRMVDGAEADQPVAVTDDRELAQRLNTHGVHVTSTAALVRVVA